MKINSLVELISVVGTRPTNQPWIVLAGDYNSEPKKYVLKLTNFSRMNNEAVLREIVGNKLAEFLGFKVPNVSFIEITNEFCADLFGKKHELFSNNTGLNIGFDYIEGGVSIVADSYSMPFDKREECLGIFCFDLLVCNFDRRVDNANIVSTGEEYYLIDHELAFRYQKVEKFEDLAVTDLLSKNYLHGMKNHVFFSSLKKSRKKIVNDSFWEKVKLLDDSFFLQLKTSIPPEVLNSAYFGKLKNEILKVVSFADELRVAAEGVLK